MKGFTLIELIIAVAVFMIIATMVTGSAFLATRIYEESEETMELIQNGRVVIDAASREIRQAERIVNSLPDSKEEGVDEIIFEDGHLEYIREEGTLQDGEGVEVVLPTSSSDQDEFYKDSFIKITSGPSNLQGEIRKIVDYDGDTRTAVIDFPLGEEDYFGLDYLIDTSHYYTHYYLEDGYVYRSVYAYYFSEDPKNYVPINATPPAGETMEEELLESRIVGEHFQEVSFWEEDGINIFVSLQLEDREMNLIKKVVGRNL